MSSSPESRVLVVVARIIAPCGRRRARARHRRRSRQRPRCAVASTGATSRTPAHAAPRIVRPGSGRSPAAPASRRVHLCAGERVQQWRSRRLCTGPERQLERLLRDRHSTRLRGSRPPAPPARRRQPQSRRRSRPPGACRSPFDPALGLDARLEQQPLEQQPRRRAGRAPRQPAAGEVRDAADPERDCPAARPAPARAATGAPAGALAGECRAHERVVEPAARSVAQVDRGSVRAASRELREPGHAAARPGHDGDGVAGHARSMSSAGSSLPARRSGQGSARRALARRRRRRPRSGRGRARRRRPRRGERHTRAQPCRLRSPSRAPAPARRASDHRTADGPRRSPPPSSLPAPGLHLYQSRKVQIWC